MRALLIPQGEQWAAQCLDYDVAASGGSITETKANLVQLLADQAAIDVAAGRRTLEGIPPAPAVFFKAWIEAYSLPQDRNVEWRVADKAVDLSGLVGGVAVKL